ncbi:hypothetical protein F5Y14DRAFT_413478 [Nemania sp. NC0429]|nr:hypothetical protein F5Y14DRAFT_413478 [Nemania sp. NC0429]
MEHKPSSGPPQGRQKMNYACEACRAAKTKCQSGPQPDICKRCSEFKRECIFRTGPRTRRPKASLRVDPEAAALPPPRGPGKTFSIDFEMPAAEEPNDSFEMLQHQHESLLENLALDDRDDESDQQQTIEGVTGVTGGDVAAQKPFDVLDMSSSSFAQKPFDFSDMSSSSPAASLSGTSSAWTETSMQRPKFKPMMNLGIKPQFNLDSATKLLASFRDMLPHMPCLLLPEDLNVREFVRQSPFVLLAILAVTSCSSSLQGHSLYDEEFRKVLGLKFVAGGERSLELLQGILIYCSWYPFHLRPKTKQTFQYLRMGVDIVHDLEMDQEQDLNLLSMSPDQRARTLNDMRALLACYYSMSSFSVTWGKTTSIIRFGPQLSQCADALEQNSGLDQDHHLVWLVRLQYIYEELVEAQRNFLRGPRDHQGEMQRNLIRAGLEAQYRVFKEKMPAQYAATTSILLDSLIIEAFMFAPPLILVSAKLGYKNYVEAVAPDRLLHAARVVRAIFDHIASLTSREFGGLSGADYTRFIVAVIFAYRLSFPMLRICRDFDVAQARRILDLGTMLQKLAETPEEEKKAAEGGEGRGGGGGGGEVKGKRGSGAGAGGAAAAAAATKKPKKSDAASAMRVVLRAVKVKFEEKSAAFEAATAVTGEEWTTRDLRSTCPMLNGSLDQYIPLWGGHQNAELYAGSHTSGSGVSVTADALSSVLSADHGTPFTGPMEQMGLDTASFEDKPLMYHDLWATMTMGWADGDMGEVNIEDFGNMGYSEMLDQP